MKVVSLRQRLDIQNLIFAGISLFLLALANMVVAEIDIKIKMNKIVVFICLSPSSDYILLNIPFIEVINKYSFNFFLQSCSINQITHYLMKAGVRCTRMRNE